MCWVKTHLHSEMTNKTLNHCMRISIEWPLLEEFDFDVAVGKPQAKAHYSFYFIHYYDQASVVGRGTCETPEDAALLWNSIFWDGLHDVSIIDQLAPWMLVDLHIVSLLKLQEPNLDHLSDHDWLINRKLSTLDMHIMSRLPFVQPAYLFMTGKQQVHMYVMSNEYSHEGCL